MDHPFPFLDRKPGLYLKDISGKGRGLCCVTDIAAGEELETTPALILTPAENRRIENTLLFNYVFTTGAISKKLRLKSNIKNLAASSCVVMGVASYCNHCDIAPNAEVVWEENNGTLYYTLRSTQDIPKHTEICTDYGENWLEEHKKYL